MKCAAYYRVSTKKQQERESIETQKVEMEPWFRRKGFKPTDFVDDGISGEEISKRPAFTRMLKQLEQGKFDVVCVFAVNRIGRFKDRADRNRVMELIINKKIRVETLFEGTFDPDNEDHMDELEKLLTEARRENRKRAFAVVRGQQRARKQGKYVSGRIPYGLAWNNVTKKYEVQTQEYRSLKEIVRLLCSGKGLTKTADILNADLEKWPTRSYLKAKAEGADKHSNWHSATINGMVKNDFLFTGELLQNRMDKDGKPKPPDEWVTVDTGIRLFDEAKIKEARHFMSLRRYHRKTEPQRQDNFLLQRIAVCGECGIKLGIRAVKPQGSKKTFRYYYCANRDKHKCSFKYVHANPLDRKVWVEFVRTFSDPKRLQQAIISEEFIPNSKKRDLEALVKSADTELLKLEGKFQRWREMFGEGDATKEEWQAKKAEIEKQQKKARATKRKAEQTLRRPKEVISLIEKTSKELADNIKFIAEAELGDISELSPKDLHRRYLQLEMKKFTDGVITTEKTDQDMDEKLNLIFKQKREILARFVATGGQVKVWDGEKFEISGIISVSSEESGGTGSGPTDLNNSGKGTLNLHPGFIQEKSYKRHSDIMRRAFSSFTITLQGSPGHPGKTNSSPKS